MKIDDTKTCSECGMPLSAASEFCPACMLRIGLEREVESGKSSSSEQASGELTQPEVVVQRFENYEVVKRQDGTPVEAKRAEEMLPVSKDALDGPALADNLATVYAWTNEPDLAFRVLDVSIKTPGGVSYGELKLAPDWDPLRTDARFDRLLAQIAPHD
jgi:hypothetical protein